ncbi:hypothetical protein EJ05DRAFT_131743 [Pseudovirgaria hyperparasitica]|uniref:Uncharacterized protein n=1 Tax=Pseudovirgaria hyperparasitica TaxID=470096 RepID=A0A6A6VVX2_9PEZI|nr:uncharacterized protein EJ05DRAFT_131743 [Pseudovirgaria hyperparasitica]KAF2754732.1 hypothetical protein EJ05DRAFT_131743 [Pseudovirgaria hyperparasitica]
MAPSYYFWIRGMREAPDHRPNTDSRGHWTPPRPSGGNISSGEDSLVFYCDGVSLKTDGLPRDAMEYKTFSIYYHSGYFWIVNYDAIDHQVGDGLDSYWGTPIRTMSIARHDGPETSWQIMTFEHDETTCASTATYGSAHNRLRGRRLHQRWVEKLLPAGHLPRDYDVLPPDYYGGMNGDLPLILGLLAFSVHANQVNWYFAHHFERGYFNTTHEVSEGCRYNGRGMVVKVWTSPTKTSTARQLDAYGDGEYGLIFG